MSSSSEVTRRAILMACMSTAGALTTGILAACGPEPGTPGPLGELYRDPTGDWQPRPVARAGLRCVATQEGNRLLLHTAGGDIRFWAGVNVGSTTPGHSPGEVSIAAEDYRRWFNLMGRMGIRFIRIYTIHRPHMYQELLTYNTTHPHAPLYLVHGIYLPDESYLESHNLFAAGPTAAMVAEIRDASAAVHGTLRRPRQRGRAWGTWTADVSAWTAAWVVGVEWDPIAGSASDRANASASPHRGRYFANTTTATPTERWITARMDELATIEAGHGLSVPIALVNWPTTDPLRHPQEPLDREDLLSVDANHCRPSPAWPGGTFASYHAYPYYPDFQLLQPDYQAGGDPYRAYLQDLNRHHDEMPVMVTEFGVPSSLGSAHRGSLRRDQGQHTEQEALAMNGDMLRMFHSLGLAGGLLFSWSDEWFKLTWNTLPRQAPADPERRALWHDPLTNEQHFGLLATDPVRAGARVTHENRTGITQVTVDHDASWLYLMISLERSPSTVQIGFDVLPGPGLSLPGGASTAVHDVAVLVDLPDRQASCWIRGSIDPILLDGLPTGAIPAPEPNGWSLQRLTLNRPYTVPGTTRRLPADFQVIGHLVSGNWDTAADFSTLATWAFEEATTQQPATLRLRLPWSMLAMADPSSHTALIPKQPPDARNAPRTQYQPTGVKVETVNVEIHAADLGQASFPFTWEGWNRAAYQERIKAGAAAFTSAVRDVCG